MPSYKHRTPGIVWCVAEGHYSYADTYNNYKAALEAPESASGVNVVIDVRKSLETRTGDEMREVAKLFAEAHSFKGKCAMLVSPDSDVRYGLARMLGAFGDLRGMDFRVFLDEEEALSWLDETPVQVACNLEALTPNERKRRASVIESIRGAVRNIEEIDNGFVIELESGYPAKDLKLLLDYEQRCCPFLRFELSPDNTSLTITGPPGSKHLVTAMFA